MRKINPTSVASTFCKDIDAMIDYYNRCEVAFKGRTTKKSDMSLLSETVFLSASVAFEGMLSDMFLAYVNKNSEPFIMAKEREIKEKIESDYGCWYSSKISIGKNKHIKVKELYPLLDPKGYNITFNNARNMVVRSKKF